ncbi:CBS domain-containing protein [Streptomyces sp. NPDC006798]|uniref:CBS domain-containing protein n=1 Tax=Streptomyces sp. NPDC006798 TaxID=3155462 RepID=UPI003404064E
MHHRTVADLMTTEVVRVRGDTPFKDVVRQLAEHRVGAVPVVDAAGRVIGVVSEADLLPKTADRPDAAGLVPLPDVPAWDLVRAEGSRAEELMSAPAVCARPEWGVVEAARLMTAQNVKRLPVVDGADRLVGVISRSDVLRVFLRRDEEIREEIRADVLADALGIASSVTAEVHDGRVALTGTVPDPALVTLAERLCHAVDGVVAVDTRITVGAKTPGTAAGPRRR